MAIEIGAIVASPPHVERERTPPMELSKSEAGLVIQDKIEGVVGYGRKPFKIFRDYQKGHRKGHNNLFSLGESDHGYIFMGSEHPGFNVPKSDLQEVGIMVMEKFGLNPDLFQVESLTRFDNGTVRERRVYRSQTVNKLEFVRWYDYVPETDKPIGVDWQVNWRGY